MAQVLEKKIDTIIFDFDNTVVDSFQSVFTNFNALLTGRGMYPVEQTTFSDKYVPDWTTMLTEMITSTVLAINMITVSYINNSNTN